jgi:hypothetical protein
MLTGTRRRDIQVDDFGLDQQGIDFSFLNDPVPAISGKFFRQFLFQGIGHFFSQPCDIAITHHIAVHIGPARNKRYRRILNQHRPVARKVRGSIHMQFIEARVSDCGLLHIGIRVLDDCAIICA